MHELLKKYVKGDKYLWGAIFMLILISIVSVLSSSTMLMYKYESGVARFFGKHTCMQIVSIFAMIFLSRTHPRFFSGLAPFTLSIGIIGIFAALLVSESVNGSTRWLNLGFMSFQPSEIAKFALVVYVAKTLAKNDKNPDDAFWHLMIVIGITCIPIMLENLSTCLLISGTCGLLMIIGRISVWRLGGVVLVAAAGISLIILFAPVMQNFFPRAMTWRARIERFIGNEDSIGKSDDYQSEQSKAAVATGGILGKGPGNSYIKNFLPEATSDFIFAIILEEYGIFGCLIVLACYVTIIGRIISISKRCTKTFHFYTILGLGILITLQACINMSVDVGLIPVTGQPLPLVSLGGTSNILTGCAMGIILSISAQVEEAEAQQQAAAVQTAAPINEEFEEDADL